MKGIFLWHCQYRVLKVRTCPHDLASFNNVECPLVSVSMSTASGSDGPDKIFCLQYPLFRYITLWLFIHVRSFWLAICFKALSSYPISRASRINTGNECLLLTEMSLLVNKQNFNISKHVSVVKQYRKVKLSRPPRLLHLRKSFVRSNGLIAWPTWLIKADR